MQYLLVTESGPQFIASQKSKTKAKSFSNKVLNSAKNPNEQEMNSLLERPERNTAC